jgi:hypothetical protein
MATLLRNLKNFEAATDRAKATLQKSLQMTLQNPLLQPEMSSLQSELQAIIDSQTPAAPSQPAP